MSNMISKRRITAVIAGLIASLILASGVLAEPWPYFPFDELHGLGNFYGEYQNYGGSGYYHDGDDLVTPDGPVPTYSVSDGTMNHITYNQPLYSGLMIGEPIPAGLGWLYWHINSETFQFDIGDPVYTNDYIGDTAYWTTANFHHVHFNKIRGTSGYPWGWYRSIGCPLEFMVPNVEPDAPVFETTYDGDIFAFARDGSATLLDPDNLSGDVDIVSRIYDIVGLPQWKLNPWRIDYWIDGATMSVSPTNTVTFTGDIPFDGTETVIYRRQSPLVTRGDYDRRIFYFNITNTDGDGWVETSDAAYSWQTGNFPAGDYWVHVQAQDVAGNVSEAEMQCTIAGIVNPDIDLPDTEYDFGSVPLGESATWDMPIQNLGIDHLSIRSVTSTNGAFTVDRDHFYVAPSGEEIVTIEFKPPGIGPYGAMIQIASNDPDEPVVEVSVEGYGGDIVSVSPDDGVMELEFLATRSVGDGFTVRFALDYAGDVEVTVFDVSGRRIEHARLSHVQPGLRSWVWDGRRSSGHRASSGVYFVRIEHDGRSVSGTGFLLR